MNTKVEQYVKEKATEFVTSLNGRYNKYVSDEFIIAYICSNYKNRWNPMANQYMNDMAYHSCIQLFESILEYGCKAGGNGHHVAQNFSNMFPYNLTYTEAKDLLESKLLVA